MVSSPALETFERLIFQVDQIEEIAQAMEVEGQRDRAQIIRRSGFVLGVASIDTYFHEHAIAHLTGAAQRSNAEAVSVANYCKSVSAAQVSGTAGASFIRLRLSYKTLVAPRSVNRALVAAGLDEAAMWQNTSFAMGTRPDRLQLQLDLLYDRRNQIAHEGDWDSVQLDFRPMERAHLHDCTTFLKALARAMNSQFQGHP